MPPSPRRSGGRLVTSSLGLLMERLPERRITRRARRPPHRGHCMTFRVPARSAGKDYHPAGAGPASDGSIAHLKPLAVAAVIVPTCPSPKPQMMPAYVKAVGSEAFHCSFEPNELLRV